MSEAGNEADLLMLLCGGDKEENRLDKVRKVEIDAANPAFYVEGGRVILGVNSDYTATSQLYYPVSKAGTARIPEGVQIVTAHAFTEGLIRELILPDSLTIFYTDSVSHGKSLGKIVFGDSEKLEITPSRYDPSAVPDAIAESLKELIFGHVKSLYFDEYAFPGVRFDVARSRSRRLDGNRALRVLSLRVARTHASIFRE